MSIPGLSAAAVQGPINILLAFGREKVISDWELSKSPFIILNSFSSYSMKISPKEVGAVVKSLYLVVLLHFSYFIVLVSLTVNCTLRSSFPGPPMYVSIEILY
jgi:hypothetical protein